jgi:hypothetical protein
MDPITPPPTGGATASLVADGVPPVRACTRCDGEQHLLDAARGFGKYRCLGCGMVVGFDLEGDPVEFLIDRGAPGRYTRDLFGSRLLKPEQRLP